MNWMRVVLAALGGFVAYFATGGVMFVAMPWMKTEFKKYPTVYRPHESIMKVMPAGMAAMFVSIAVLAMIYAMGYTGRMGSGGGSAVWRVDWRVCDGGVYCAQLC